MLVRVLLVGGVGVGWTFLSSAEIYDPATDTFTPTGDLLAARESYTATLLGNGKVLITGDHSDSVASSNAWLYRA